MNNNDTQSENSEKEVEQNNDTVENQAAPEQDFEQKWMRCLADYDNLKKEMAEKRQEWSDYAEERLLRDLLPVFEHFKTGLKYIPEEHKSADWMMGFTQIQKQFAEFLSKNDIEEIKTIGEPFNPLEHDAVGSKEEEGKDADLVLEEVSTGYKRGDKVIQAARVIISK